MRGPKKTKKLALVLAFFICIPILSFLFIYNVTVKRPIKGTDESIIVNIKKGDGFYDVLNELKEKGKLRNEFMIKINLSINKRDIKLKQGVYEIDKNFTLNDIIYALEGKKKDIGLISLTIPEGYTVEDIAYAIQEKGIATEEEFLNAVKSYKLPSFVEKKENVKYNLEGYLYPDTYYVEKNTDLNVIIKMMIDRFETVLNQIETENNIDIKKEDLNKVITISSIIEKEARVDTDRSLISSVILNRLEKNMKLQIDATVIYALGEHVDKVLYSHLKKDSPYNTYMYSGLPVGPICNPGKKSIEAAIMPQDSNYIYYILEKDGSHYFTKDYDDFLQKKKDLRY